MLVIEKNKHQYMVPYACVVPALLYFLVHFESLISALESTPTCSGPGLILGSTDFDGSDVSIFLELECPHSSPA